MSIDLARRILSAADDARLDLMFAHGGALIWDAHGDEVAQFNRIIARYPGIPPASIEGSHEQFEVRYKHASVTVPLAYDRQDHLRAVIALAGLTRHDLAIRLCLATGGRREFAFLMLPPEQWQALEEELGSEALDRDFMALGDSCEVFYARLAAAERVDTAAVPELLRQD